MHLVLLAEPHSPYSLLQMVTQYGTRFMELPKVE